MLELVQYQIHGSTARQIAASAETSIREELIAPGAPLPTVRALAGALGTSPATVNAAYRLLRERGLVVAEGRKGTRVAPRPAVRSPDRTRAQARPGLRDLSIGLPDPELLPPLAAALGRASFAEMDGFEFADPRLLQFAREWFGADGIEAGEIAVVSGALDGIERLLSAHLRAGDRVLIEDPTYPPIRDIVLALGLVEVPVAVDERGLRPDALRAALQREAQAVFVIPRAQNPTGAALDPERAAELQEVLARHPELLVLEDDHASEVAGAEFHSTIGTGSPRWAVIRSTSKVLHPDLRVAVIAGDAETIGRVEGRQALGPRWVSHLLQRTAAAMLSDPGFPATSRRAAAAYKDRRTRLIDALAARDVVAHGRTGLNVWLPVREEAPVLRALLEAGWLALSGERFRLATSPGLRITVTTLAGDEPDELAEVIAPAVHAGRPRRVY